MPQSEASAGLDNPFWTALASVHADLAQRAGEVARFPAAYAPFLGIAHAEVELADALDALVAADESVYLIGVAPHSVPRGWQLETFDPLIQMVCDAPLAEVAGPPIVAMDESQRSEVLALTALVYPHYFRERTMELGRYFGIYSDGRLAAMIGERLGSPNARELSAICTHPDFLGRGLAARLTTMLCNDILASGRLPFLHVSRANTRALALYERLGFRRRVDIGFWSLRRA